MPGDYWQKFAGLRAFFAYWMAHPGKKLLFMGGEFGQFIEWKYDDSLDWHLPQKYPMHEKMQHYSQTLNQFYNDNKPLWQVDFDWNGFQWIDCNDNENSVISFIRKAEDPNDSLIVICNFTPEVRHGYRVGVPAKGSYVEVLNTDAEEFGGSGVRNEGELFTEDVRWHDRNQSIVLTLPPLAVVYLRQKDQADARVHRFANRQDLTVKGYEAGAAAEKVVATAAEAPEAPKPRRRGRPKMTEEQKAAARVKREAEKQAKIDALLAQGFTLEEAKEKIKRRRKTTKKTTTTAKKPKRTTTRKRTTKTTARKAVGEE